MGIQMGPAPSENPLAVYYAEPGVMQKIANDLLAFQHADRLHYGAFILLKGEMGVSPANYDEELVNSSVGFNGKLVFTMEDVRVVHSGGIRRELEDGGNPYAKRRRLAEFGPIGQVGAQSTTRRPRRGSQRTRRSRRRNSCRKPR